MLQQKITVQVSSDEMKNAVTYFIQKANSFPCRATVSLGEKRVNAKSLLGLLSMDLRQGMELTLTADGEGAAEALAALSAILEPGA